MSSGKLSGGPSTGASFELGLEGNNSVNHSTKVAPQEIDTIWQSNELNECACFGCSYATNYTSKVTAIIAIAPGVRGRDASP